MSDMVEEIVSITPPKMVVYGKGIYYAVDVLVDQKVFTHIDYYSVDKVTQMAQEHVDMILDGHANIEAWKAAHE